MTAAELAERRRALGLTQHALAERLGVRAQSVNRWEQGKQAMPPYLDAALFAIEHGWQPRTEG